MHMPCGVVFARFSAHSERLHTHTHTHPYSLYAHIRIHTHHAHPPQAVASRILLVLFHLSSPKTPLPFPLRGAKSLWLRIVPDQRLRLANPPSRSGKRLCSRPSRRIDIPGVHIGCCLLGGFQHKKFVHRRVWVLFVATHPLVSMQRRFVQSTLQHKHSRRLSTPSCWKPTRGNRAKPVATLTLTLPPLQPLSYR